MHKGRRVRVENLAGEIARGGITDLLKKRGVDRRDIHEIVLARGRRRRGLLQSSIDTLRRLGLQKANDPATAQKYG
jgi:hypothetical protein